MRERSDSHLRGVPLPGLGSITNPTNQQGVIMEVKRWLIISYKHNDLMDGAYGLCLDAYEGRYQDAAEAARKYTPEFSPVVVCGVIE
jgi:hypothetical protein